jgi:hypothetical protein
MAKQYLLEIEYTVIVESSSEDAEEVGNNFVAQLTELVASNDHILGLEVNAFPLPALRHTEH